jgi:hypothetical protein
MFRRYTLSIYTLRFIRSDVIRSVFVRSDVIRSDVIRSVIIRSVGESYAGLFRQLVEYMMISGIINVVINDDSIIIPDG